MSRGGGRSPSMSRGGSSQGASSRQRSSGGARSNNLARPSGGQLGGGNRPGGGQLGGANRPGAGQLERGERPTAGQLGGASSPGAGNRPGGARVAGRTGPGAGGRPTQGQLNQFLDIKSPGSRPSSRLDGSQFGSAVAGGLAGGAAADFLQDRGSAGQRPAERPSVGQRPDVGSRPEAGARPGAGERPLADARPGAADRPRAEGRPGDRARPGTADRLADHRSGRIDNPQQWNNNRLERRSQVRSQIARHPPRRDFWLSHPNWARWRWNRPYRWATWAAVAAWFPGWGWSEPAIYSYGDNVYYEGDNVYYGDQPVASTEEYAQQAAGIVESSSPPADDSQWLSLGVFALTQDGESSGPVPTMFLQLMVSKDGVLAGSLYNNETDESREIEGAVDKSSQRAAWVVKDEQWPIMETGLENLTKDEAPALLHFGDGQTQQWLLVRLEDPENTQP